MCGDRSEARGRLSGSVEGQRQMAEGFRSSNGESRGQATSWGNSGPMRSGAVEGEHRPRSRHVPEVSYLPFANGAPVGQANVIQTEIRYPPVSAGAPFVYTERPYAPMGVVQPIVPAWNAVNPPSGMSTAYGASTIPHPGHVPRSNGRMRKPYEKRSAVRETWTNEEHEKFIEGLKLYERDWKKIEQHVESKTVIQIRSHAQKYFEKVQKNGSSEYVPPARPRKKREAKPDSNRMQQAPYFNGPSAAFMPVMNGMRPYVAYPTPTNGGYAQSGAPGVCLQCQHHYHHGHRMAVGQLGTAPPAQDEREMNKYFDRTAHDRFQSEFNGSSGSQYQTSNNNERTRSKTMKAKSELEKREQTEQEKKWFKQSDKQAQSGEEPKGMSMGNEEDGTMGSSNSDEGGSGANVNDGSSGNGLSSDDNGDRSPEGKTSGGECDILPPSQSRGLDGNGELKGPRTDKPSKHAKVDDGDNVLMGRSTSTDGNGNSTDRSPSDPPSSDKRTVSSTKESEVYCGESTQSNAPSSSRNNKIERTKSQPGKMTLKQDQGSFGSSGSASPPPPGTPSEPNSGSGRGSSNPDDHMHEQHHGKKPMEKGGGHQANSVLPSTKVDLQQDSAAEKRIGSKRSAENTPKLEEKSTMLGHPDKGVRSSSRGQDPGDEYIRGLREANVNPDIANVVCTAISILKKKELS